MSKAERMNWIINIENSAAEIESEIGADTVNAILCRYGADSIDEIRASDLPSVFSELYAIEADLR